MHSINKVEFGFGFLIKDYPEHFDDFFELHYIYKGSGILKKDNILYSLKPDTLLISPPGERHSIKVDKCLGFHVIRLKYTHGIEELLYRVCKRCQNLGGFTLHKSRRYEFDRLKLLVSLNTKEAYDSAWYGIISILGELIIPNSNTKVAYSKDILTEIIRYMGNHIDKKMKLEDFSSFFNITPSKLTKLFKVRTGFSAMEYFLRLKIDAACYMLTSSKILNKDIALQLGFSDEFHFSKTFKNKTELSPREYRERYKTKKIANSSS
ncbi:AraC family transcriptional regulator [Thiospirochaeta perfilievii]|nr:AraC family transcriptional regulator [Thiospirochaeta perfilievii]